MAARSADSSSTNQAVVTTPNERELVITRSFRAPREAVFEAWTKPEHVTHWWDPTGAPLESCEIDLRAGGEFRFVHRGSGHVFSGIYREIAPPDRLVFITPVGQGREATGRLVFEEQDGGTLLTMTMECPSAADRDRLLAMRVDAGTVRTLQNLAEYLER